MFQQDAQRRAAHPPPPGPPPPPPPPPVSQPQVISTQLEQLKQLGELKEQGVLTEAEFEVQKSRILGT